MHSEERQSCIDQIFALPTRVEAAIGEVTLAGLLKIYAWHGVHHVGQITGLRESGCGEENGDLVI